MKPVFTMPDDQFAMCAGFDALTFVRFYGLCMKVCLLASILCVCIILPVNYTGSGTDVRSGQFEEFDKTTSINIKNGSKRLWAHIAVMTIITLGTLWVRSNLLRIDSSVLAVLSAQPFPLCALVPVFPLWHPARYLRRFWLLTPCTPPSELPRRP
jgi:hypothetical protein